MGPAAEDDFTVPDDEWAELEQELRAAHFDRMKPHYRRDRPYADGYRYRTTYEGRTISCDQDSGPEGLRRVNAHLERLMSEALRAADEP